MKSLSTQPFSCRYPCANSTGFIAHIRSSVAGSETTASSLAALANNLLRHPQVYAKLKDEIRSTFMSEDEIKLSVANNLPYLNACIEENLRIFPPAPIGFLRAIQQGGDIIDGHSVPEGVSNRRRSRIHCSNSCF